MIVYTIFFRKRRIPLLMPRHTTICTTLILTAASGASYHRTRSFNSLFLCHLKPSSMSFSSSYHPEIFLSQCLCRVEQCFYCYDAYSFCIFSRNPSFSPSEKSSKLISLVFHFQLSLRTWPRFYWNG